jgi:flagellar basal body L-ring protein FlgH
MREFERDVSKDQAPVITQPSVSPTDMKRQPQQQQNVQQQEEQLYYRKRASQKHLWPPSPNGRLTRLNRPQCWVTCQRQQQHKELSVQASANQVKSSQQYGAKLPSEKYLTPQQQWDMAKKQHYQLQYQLPHPAKASYDPKHGHRRSRTRVHHQSLFKRRYPQPPGNVQTIACDEAEIDSASSSTSSSASLPGSRSFFCSSDSTYSSGSGYEKFRLHHSQDPAAQNLCGTGASRTFGSRVFVGVSPLRLDSEDVRQHLELRPPECYQPCLDRSRDNINDSSTDGKEDIYLIDKTFTRAGVGEAEGGQEDEHALRSEESPNAMLAELDDYFSSDWRID